MPRLSPAFKRFEVRLAEVNHLRRMSGKFGRLHLRNGLDKVGHSNALVRGATVLLCSHVQGFIEDLAEEVVRRLVQDQVSSTAIPDRFRFYATKRDVEEILKEPDRDKLISRIRRYAVARGDILSKEGPVHPSYLDSSYKDGFGNPTTGEIRRFFRRMGYEEFDEDLKRRLGRNYLTATNAIDQIVDRRTKIAHGDSQASLTTRELMEYTGLVRAFCSSTDSVTCTHFRRKGCRFD
jgi:hypothetical protein